VTSIREIKSRLVGESTVFNCHLLKVSPGSAVVHYHIDRGRTVGDLVLPDNADTLGYFWQDRPYNVYHFIDPSGQSLGWYCNISDQTRINANTICWRDLVVDVLLLPDGRTQVLDRDELPLDLPAQLVAYIDNAVRHLLQDSTTLIETLEQSKKTWIAKIAGN